MVQHKFANVRIRISFWSAFGGWGAPLVVTLLFAVGRYSCRPNITTFYNLVFSQFMHGNSQPEQTD